MSWWEIIAMFVGIPIAVCVGVGTLVFWLTENRVPDGLDVRRHALRHQSTRGPRPQPSTDARSYQVTSSQLAVRFSSTCKVACSMR